MNAYAYVRLGLGCGVMKRQLLTFADLVQTHSNCVQRLDCGETAGLKTEEVAPELGHHLGKVGGVAL